MRLNIRNISSCELELELSTSVFKLWLSVAAVAQHVQMSIWGLTVLQPGNE